MRHSFLLLLFIFSLHFLGHSQGAKQISSRKIKTIHSVVTELKKGIEIRRTTISSYDKKGRLVEETILDKDSICISKETFRYNRKGDLLEHTTYEKAHHEGVKKEKTEYDRWGRDTLKTEFDESGKVQQYTRYIYNNNDDKISEQVFDAENKILKTTTFVYDKRGMVLSRKTTNDKGEVIYEKQNTYTY